jgi:hypothetical protein
MMRVSRGLLTFGLLVLAATGVSLAQSNTASVYGTIADSSKAIVPGADVTLTNQANGLIKTTTSNRVGQFTFNYIPVGVYALKVASNGFEAQEITGITLEAAQAIELDFQLKVQSVSQTVQVTSAEPLLDLASSEQRGNISNLQLSQLPVQKQDWTSLLKTSAGVAQITAQDAIGGSGIVMNGLPGASFNLTVDGTNASSQPDIPAFGFYQQPNIINTINNDAIQEVSLVRGIVPASVSGTMSGNVNIITKGGTNEFHGDLFEINDENLYNARNQFLKTRPRYTFNQYGGALGGPILRNKAFFFGSYEGARLSSLTVINANVPSPYLISISPAAFTPIFQAYPAPPAQPAGQPTALTVNINEASSQRQDDGNTVARLDYNLSANNIFTLRYTRARPIKFAPQIISIDPRVTTGHQDAYTGQWIHSGSNWSSNARLGYNRVRISRDDLGIGSDFEALSFSGVSTGGSELLIKAGSIYTAEEGVSYTFGRHTLQVGGIFQRMDEGRSDQNTTSLKYSSLSDFQANIPSSIQITFYIPPYALYFDQSGGYVQDDFKVSSRLTLNLGVRYDYWTVVKCEKPNCLFNRGVDPANPQWGGGFGPYRPENSVYNATRNDFAPRVGFSLGLGAKSDTVVRGGFGIFTNPHPLYNAAGLSQISATEPFRVTLNRAQGLAAGLKYPVPQASYGAILQNLTATGLLSTNFTNSTFDTNYPNPYSEQWLLDVQHMLPWRTALDVAYVGNRGLHENIVEDANLPSRATGIAPDPTVSEFSYYYAGDASNYNGLQVELTKRFEGGLSLGANYTYSKALALEQAGLLLETPPQDNGNIRADYGRTPFDVRNNFVAHGLWDLPVSRWTHTSGRLVTELIDGWQVSGVFSANDGFPLNLTNGNSSYPSDRPDPVAGVSPYIGGYNLGHLQYLNKAAFVNPAIVPASGAQARGGLLARDFANQPGYMDLDASLAKTVHFSERIKLQLRMDAFNALNHTNLSGLQTNTSSGSFGQLTSATARTLQIGGRLIF